MASGLLDCRTQLLAVLDLDDVPVGRDELLPPLLDADTRHHPVEGIGG